MKVEQIRELSDCLRSMRTQFNSVAICGKNAAEIGVFRQAYDKAKLILEIEAEKEEGQ